MVLPTKNNPVGIVMLGLLTSLLLQPSGAGAAAVQEPTDATARLPPREEGLDDSHAAELRSSRTDSHGSLPSSVWPSARTIAAAPFAGRSRAAAAPQGSSERGLEYGAHAVGFAVVEALDQARAFRPLRDFRGRLAEETARPLQVSIWYPAAPDATAARLRAGDFRLLRASEVDFGVMLSADDEAVMRRAFIEESVSLGQRRDIAARTWDELTPAMRDAPPLLERYPVVLYLTAAGVSNPLLPAYLASHGFVVASFPSNGRMTEVSLRFTPNGLTLDTDVDDAGFVKGLLRDLPYADTDRLAVLSFSSGSLAALLWAMRDMQVTAIASIDGWERFRRGVDIVTESVHFEPQRVRVPYLMLERAAAETSPLYAKVPDVVDDLVYADITRVAFRDAAHADFLSHVPLGHTPQHEQIYRTSARIIRLFLEATVVGSNVAVDALAALAPPPSDRFFTVSRSAALPPVPTEEELFRLAETNPVNAAAAYREAARTVPGATLFAEDVLTRAATFAPTEADAAIIMEIVVSAYPLSTRARYRLAQAMVGAGRLDDARSTLHEAAEIVRQDPSLSEQEREEWERRVREEIERIGR